MFEFLTANISGTTREEMLEGRLHLVAPCVMLTEGVHKGSNGAALYLKDEMEDTPPTWNHKPIVVYHPQQNGKHVSASAPAILNTQKIGLVLNTAYDTKLRTEVWLDIEKTKKVDIRILDKIRKGEKVEVSTGLYLNQDLTPGEWNGKSYDWIARKHRPDHLAILPEGEGACSIKDGAGILQVNQAIQEAIERKVGYSVSLSGGETEVIVTPEVVIVNNGDKKMDKTELINGLITNGGYAESDRAWLTELSDDAIKKIKPIPAPVVNKAPEVKPTTPEVTPPVTPEVAKPLTVNEYIQNAPQELRGPLQSILESHEAEKNRLIGIVVNSKSNVFSKEYLATLDVGMLKGMAALVPTAPAATVSIPPAMFNYAGQAGGAPVVNSNDQEEPLPLPTLFADKK